jgi:hypothetical protein
MLLHVLLGRVAVMLLVLRWPLLLPGALRQVHQVWWLLRHALLLLLLL